MTDNNKTFDRALDIISEIALTFKQHQSVEPHVTIFGSARLNEGNIHFNNVAKLSRMLSDGGVPVMSGGGPGIMEAANMGAQAGLSKSFAAGIKLPFEDGSNAYVDHYTEHKYFMIRKWLLMTKAVGIVGAAGGFGTIDEIAEVLTLIQTKKIKPIPIVLIGKKFWHGFDYMNRNCLLPEGTISKADLDLYTIVDSPEEACDALLKGIAKDNL